MSYKVTHARNFPYHLSLSDGIIYHTVLQWYKAPMCFMFSHFLFKGQSKFKAAEKAPHTPLLYYLYLQKVSLCKLRCKSVATKSYLFVAGNVALPRAQGKSLVPWINIGIEDT